MSTNLFMFFVFTFVSLTILSAIVEGHTGLETTELTAGISETSTTITVKTTDPFADRGQLMIGDETICYTGKNSVQFTGVTRGADCRRFSEAQAFPAGQQVMVEGTGIVNQLVGFDILSAFGEGGISGFVLGSVNVVSNLPSFLNAVARMLVWDYSFLDGSFVYLKYLVLYPLSAGMVLSFVRLALGR
jgi:hypothetical protein